MTLPLPAIFSYSTKSTVSTLRRILNEEGVDELALGYREHYLCWHTSETARQWDERGLDYDSTLRYADYAGFRCSTCREFALYDLQQRRPLRLQERPLILMECSVLAKKYIAIDDLDQALSVISGLRDACENFGGDFRLLWDNSELITQAQKEMYSELAA